MYRNVRRLRKQLRRRASNIAQEKSRRSLMFAENATR